MLVVTFLEGHKYSFNGHGKTATIDLHFVINNDDDYDELDNIVFVLNTVIGSNTRNYTLDVRVYTSYAGCSNYQATYIKDKKQLEWFRVFLYDIVEPAAEMPIPELFSDLIEDWL